MIAPGFFLATLFALTATLSAEETVPDFAAIYALMDEHCVECHTAEEYEGGLILETHEALMKGGESGVSIVPGKSAESLLVKYLRGEVEKDGKRRFMPPGKREKLTPEEITLLARWIDAGAKPSAAGAEKPRELIVAKIAPKVTPRDSVNALAATGDGKLVAAGRFQTVELISAETREVVRRLNGHRGNVNALAFSPDGSQLFSASGENALYGEVKQWNVADGTLLRTIRGHRDTLYALAISPDGKTLATGSYDQQIKLWSVATGAELKTLRGHNGAVYAVAFRPDGKILASASADRTVKLWDAATGQRRDTLSQSLKELFAIAWSLDGKRLAAGGVDNRLRVWEVSAEAKETTNPILFSRFAHDGTILRIAWSADGRTLLSASQDQSVKLWDPVEMKERKVLEKQPDWVGALAFAAQDATIVAGRQDGSLAFYDAQSGAKLVAEKPEVAAAVATAQGAAAKPKAQPKGKAGAKMALAGVEPRGIQRGGEAKVKLLGSALAEIAKVKFADARIVAQFGDDRSDTEAWLTIQTPADLPRGAYDFTAFTAEGKEAGALKLLVDDLPQIYATEQTGAELEKLPASIWSALETPGDSDRFEIEAQAGQTLVFDLASKSLGSKTDAVLSVLDRTGKVLASNNDFDNTGDPLVAYTFEKAGRYFVSVSDLQFGGSKEHFFRLSAGEFPFVTACFPLSIPANSESEVEMIGFNLPAERKLKIATGAAGEMALPLDPEKVRSRRGFKVLVSDLAHFVETEPNDTPAQATRITLPASVGGLIRRDALPRVPNFPIKSVPPENQERAGARPSESVIREAQRRVPQAPEVSPLAPVISTAPVAEARSGTDFDLYQFEAKASSVWAIETAAAQRGSPMDTKLEVLHADGRPVERLLLQAVRDSAITFRSIDSTTNDVRVDNWEEMELNQFIYLGGEVAKIFRMPEGPDSGFQFYNLNGKRQAYFNTTAIAHALEEPCYIVEPHPPGAQLVSNGLPVFPIYYTNDDDGDRKLGTDSRLIFTAPADGSYLVRVSDSRGMSGDRYAYRLVVREAKPDFAVALTTSDKTVNAGSGQSFTLNADRKDGFEGDVSVEITDLPAGFKVSTPLVIEAGHQSARGSLFALPGAPVVSEEEWKKVKVLASAMIAGGRVVRSAEAFGKINLGEAPKVFVALEPAAPGDTLAKLSQATPMQEQDPALPYEITIAPGEIIPAWIKVKRNGHTTELRFDVENLPHGVIVDNLGLNGITLLSGQDAGEIALKAAPWVQETNRLCFALTRDVGKQASLPVMLHVRKKATAAR